MRLTRAEQDASEQLGALLDAHPRTGLAGGGQWQLEGGRRC